MNRFIAFLVPALLVVLLITPPCGAAPSKDEANLQRESSGLDKTASSSSGEAAVIKRLTKDFGVGSDRVASLREKGLSYGELAIVLSLAQKMPDGITDTSVEKVIALRRGPPVAGWGAVAKQLRVKLGTAVSQVKKVNNEAHREMKAEDHEVQRAPEKQAEPAASPAEERKTFSGEGKDMSRGRAAE